MSLLERALEALARRRDETVQLMKQLVLVNSYSGNVDGVNAVGTLLIEALAELPLGLTVTTEGGIRHLSFLTERAESAPSMLLIGHHDTVFPLGEFEGYSEQDDLARGPGVLDMKGGLALIVTVLRALHDVDALASLPLCFVSVGDEETGSTTSRPLLEELAKRAQLALVFEAGRSGDALITARRGVGNACVEARGKAAHAGNALAEGVSAIWALAKFIDRVQGEQAQIQGASASIGLVHGGTARNTVPDRALAELDLRFSDTEGQQQLTALLERAAREAEAAVPGSVVEVEIAITRRPWARTEASSALARRYGEAQRAAGLQASEAPLIGGGSDANTVGALGVPTIDGLGPRGSGFHTRSEHASLASFPMKAEALLRFLLTESNVTV